MLNVLKLSFGALRERRVRAVITILMVLIGSALITGLNGMSQGMNEYIVQQFSTLGANVIIVIPGGLRSGATFKITDQTRGILENIPGVEAVEPFIQQSVTIRSAGSSASILVVGLDHDKIPLVFPTLTLSDGRLGSSNNPTILLGNNVAYPPGETAPFATVGHTVSLEYLTLEGQKTVTHKRTYLVEGIIEYMGSTGMFIPVDRIAFIPLSAANSFFGRGGSYDATYVVASDEKMVDSVSDELQNIFRGNAEIFTAKSILRMIQSIMGTLQIFLGSIASVSLIVAAVGIFAALYTSVLERTREIGILKALGFNKLSITLLFLSEAMIIGFIGGASGNAAGIAIGYLLVTALASTQSPMGEMGTTQSAGAGPVMIQPIFTPEMLILVWVFSIALSIFAGVYPAWRASRLDPVVALRKE